jgi:hypothetical protein
VVTNLRIKGVQWISVTQFIVLLKENHENNIILHTREKNDIPNSPVSFNREETKINFK